jgi:hypothetical protein
MGAHGSVLAALLAKLGPAGWPTAAQGALSAQTLTLVRSLTKQRAPRICATLAFGARRARRSRVGSTVSGGRPSGEGCRNLKFLGAGPGRNEWVTVGGGYRERAGDSKGRCKGIDPGALLIVLGFQGIELATRRRGVTLHVLGARRRSRELCAV